MPGIELVVGHPEADHLRIGRIARAGQPVRDIWDANWLAATITVSAGGWKGESLESYVRAEELSAFRSRLAHLRDGRVLEAILDPIEKPLFLKLAARDNEIEASGSACDRPQGCNVISFRFRFGRDLLDAMIRQLVAIEEAFPPHGCA